MIVCPGCGGRNPPDTQVCEWCERPFVAQHHNRPGTGTALVLAAAVVLVGILAVGLFVVMSRVGAGRGTTANPPSVVVGNGAELANPDLSGADASDSADGAAEYVQVGNTGGAGAFIRSEPQTASPSLATSPDGTVLIVVGPDVTSAGTTWRHVQNQDGVDGWTPAAFLLPSDTGF